MDRSVRNKRAISSVISVLITATVGWVAIAYMDAQAKADQAQVDSLAALLGAVSADNFADRASVVHEQDLRIAAAIEDCQQISALLPEHALPAGYRITPKSITLNGTTECELIFGKHRAIFVGHGI